MRTMPAKQGASRRNDMYKCGKCGATVAKLSEASLRCPACSNKILYKERAPVAKEIKAR